jgi:GntR family transcriptional repressor for pyruvate dehydrogenase complex
MNNPTPDLPQNTDSALTARPATLRSKSSGSSRNLGNLLFDEFESKIRQGLLQEGEKLPTESALVRTYEVSRTVVREALSKLQAAELVQTKHGIGTFVLPMRAGKSPVLNAHELTASVDVLAVLELRISLETECAGLAAKRRNTEQLTQMQNALHAFKHAFIHGQQTISHDLNFHLLIAEATGNRYFSNILRHFDSQLIPRTRITSINQPQRDPDYLLRVNREHEEILSAITRQDAETARAAMRIHLTNSRERLRLAQKTSQP